MTTLEKTFYVEFAVGSSGASGIQYFPISDPVEPVGSVFVIKNMTIQTTSGIGASGPAFNFILYSSDDNAGLNQVPIRCVEKISLPSSQIDLPFTATNQITLTKPYLGLNINMSGAGTVYVTMSYCLIPSTNGLITTFGNTNGGPSTGTSTLISSDTVETRLVRGCYLLNLDSVNTYTTRLFYRPFGGSDYAISNTITMTPYDSFSYIFGLLLQNSVNPDSLIVTVSGAGSGIHQFTSFITST